MSIITTPILLQLPPEKRKGAIAILNSLVVREIAVYRYQTQGLYSVDLILREIEWIDPQDGKVYKTHTLLSPSQTNWVRKLVSEPQHFVRIS